ncbi:hypothetical protein Ciccas_005293 [Cichlidogyrus casuarinus]|uniref:Uncharacterized protein n=1 Tax=Cichlidogyrus casuarinus TaxID=1844966 RepID=A0ABD2Q921_9PLAT
MGTLTRPQRQRLSSSQCVPRRPSQSPSYARENTVSNRSQDRHWKLQQVQAFLCQSSGDYENAIAVRVSTPAFEHLDPSQYLPVTDNEPILPLPFKNEKEPSAGRLEQITPFVYQQAPQIGDQKMASKTRDNALKSFNTFIHSSEAMTSADLQGEYSAFHWLPNLGKKKWNILGLVNGWAELALSEDVDSKLTYIRLPRMDLSPESICYPCYPLNSLMNNWLTRRTTVPQIGSEKSFQVHNNSSDLLQNCSVLMSLKEILSLPENSCSQALRHCFNLATLLSIDFCQATAVTNDLCIDLDPNHVLICYSHANCLVLFRLCEECHQPNKTCKSLSKLLENMGHSVDCQETMLSRAIDNEVSALKVYLQQVILHDEQAFMLNVLQAVSPPDWSALILSRIGKLHI